MKSEIIQLQKRKDIIKKNKSIKSNSIRSKKKFYLSNTFLIILIFLVFICAIIINKIYKIKLFKHKNKFGLIQNKTNPDTNACSFIKNKLENRTQPFDYENELEFFISLISCKIPFSFIRFADGEELIMRGEKIDQTTDKWYWDSKNAKFRNSLIESSSICTIPNNFIGLPCKNWIGYSRSILSFSNCTSSKYMSYATLFVNKNYPQFKKWILSYINTSNRWKIILVANSNINKDISWADKFFPIPEHIVENWEEFRQSKLPKISEEAKGNDLIFFVSAGPAANIIISYLTKINNKNIYVDFGSSIEFITKGYETRPYPNPNSEYSKQRCESYIIKDKDIIYQS